MARIERASLNRARAFEEYPASPQDVLEALNRGITRLPRWALTEAGNEELHAVHETSFFRFRDDVRMSILPAENGSRIECESRSRLGIYDFGQNGRNLSELLAEIERELW